MPASTDENNGSAGGPASGPPDPAWRKSSHCPGTTECTGETNCVEVRRLSPDLIGLRDSARPEVVLSLSRRRFSALLQEIIDRTGH
ncbi:DUF397 domain-containing protein [Actinomadura nitritigenes]|uniref:DUF397 domain-containing protein n=1 Tax=Actinomadura nitritigenes TaxID=134602 RepID=UPI003D8CA2FB